MMKRVFDDWINNARNLIKKKIKKRLDVSDLLISHTRYFHFVSDLSYPYKLIMDQKRLLIEESKVLYRNVMENRIECFYQCGIKNGLEISEKEWYTITKMVLGSDEEIEAFVKRLMGFEPSNKVGIS